MDYLKSFAISAAGMTAERTRVDVAALNLANANTIQTPDAAGYRPMTVVMRSLAAPIDASRSMSVFSARIDEGVESAFLSAPQTSIEAANVAPRNVYEPGNPFANSKGFLVYPGVDTATEMVTMLSAQRSYEANVAAMNVARTLAMKTLDIGGQG
jgi:flagellar basal-body rod protein FlgC